MLKNVFILFIADFVEIIHIELANKRGEVTMSKVNGQNLLLKSLHIQNSEIGALFVPCNNARMLIALNRLSVTYRISKAFDMKIEGPATFSLFQRPLQRSSFQSGSDWRLLAFFYVLSISKVRLIDLKSKSSLFELKSGCR